MERVLPETKTGHFDDLRHSQPGRDCGPGKHLLAKVDRVGTTLLSALVEGAEAEHKICR